MGDDAEMREELRRGARERIEELEEEIRLAMVERDPNDDKNVIVEIQGGAGGEEAGLWAGDLYRMLSRYAERRGFADRADGRSATASTRSRSRATAPTRCSSSRAAPTASSACPQTESQGRIHTSTATVAVLPEAEDVDVQIDPGDLQIDVYRSSGPGGQSVNTTDSAVRVTHRPSGIVVSMQDEKSQLQNREKALRVLRARLYERALAEQQAELAADRRSQVGTGDRAEKIRTYNYGERRVTDHRIKLTVHNLDQVLEGELDELTAALQADEKRRARWRQQAAARERARPPAHARRGDALRRARARSPRSAPPAATTPRLDAELLLAHVLGVARERCSSTDAPGASTGPAVRAVPGRRAPPRGGARAGRLHPRAARLPAPRADRRPPRADPAPGDRAARRGRRSRSPRGRARARRRHRQRRGRARAEGRAPGPAIVSASDVSAAALAVARANAPRLGLDVRWLHADLLDGLRDEFDAVLANPPYVAEASARAARPRSPATSPPAALFARRGRPRRDPRAARAASSARACALLALEVGDGQARAVAALVAARGLRVGRASRATWRASSASSWRRRRR